MTRGASLLSKSPSKKRSSRSRALPLLALFALVLVALTMPSRAQAVDDASLTWFTYETAHFKVTYPEPLDPVAKRIAVLAESIYLRLVEEMQFAPEERTEILLTDDSEDANGFASPVPYNNIHLYATAPPDLSTLGDYDDWVLELVTHEYTHILHTGNISGLSAIANRIIGRTLSPNSAQPRWILEGLAVVEESKHSSAGRVRSSLFDMWMRADVLEDNFASLGVISNDPQRWPPGNIVYLYGSRFLRWIVDVYGPDTMPAVSADYGASTIPFGINRAIRRVTGVTYEELYEAWHKDLITHYKEQIAAVDRYGRIEGAQITFHGRNVEYPRFATPAARVKGNEDELFYYLDDLSDVSGLYRMKLGDPDRRGKRAEELVAQTDVESNVTFTPGGDLLFQSLEYDHNVYERNDLFSLPKGVPSKLGTESERKRLTVGARAVAPDVSPNGDQVAFTVNAKSTTSLVTAPIKEDGSLGEKHLVVSSPQFGQVYTPRFSPDGSKIAYSSWSEGGFRDVRIADPKTGTFVEVTHDRSLDMEPVWSPDGKTLYFSSDRSGIFNIYAYDLGTKKFSMVTNVHMGAFMPAVSPDGKKLVYVGYTHEGYDLFSMTLDPNKFLPSVEPPEDRPEPPPEQPGVKLERHKYNPLPTFYPHSYSANFGSGYYSSTAFTFSTEATDLVGHHDLTASITIEPEAPAPRYSLDYEYSGLPVNLYTGFSQSTVPRTSGFRIGGTTIPFDETLTGGYVEVGLPVHHPYVDQSFSFTYQGQYSSAKLQKPPVETIDPQSTITTLPLEGFLSQIKLSYSLSSIQGGYEQAGSARGISFRLDGSYSGQETFSDFSYYALSTSIVGYIPMPWPGHHTLAVRGAGAVSGGSYAKRGIYFVGGYDLANNSLIDQLLNSTYSGSFVLRGYGPSEFSGNEYALLTLEYRAPLLVPNLGPSTLPIFLQRIDQAFFFDWGGAFDDLQIKKTRFFRDGDLIYLPTMHASLGSELWFRTTVANRIDMTFRVGYAYGFSSAVHPDGQLYFLAASSF